MDTFYYRCPGKQDFLIPFFLSLTLFGSAWFFATVYYVFPDLPRSGITGYADLSIQSMCLQRSFFGRRWTYNCEIRNFFPENKAEISIARHIKCTLSIPDKDEIIRPLANRNYIVKGTLIEKDTGMLALKIDPLKPWQEVKGSRSLTEARYGWKKTVANWINTNFKSPLSASFLRVLATGEFDDRWLRNEFARFGLQHIMAISGFHFAILACLLSLIFRLFFIKKSKCVAFINRHGRLCFFFRFKSFHHACVVNVLNCFSWPFIRKRGGLLNSLGMALIGVLLIDPLFSQTIGFQFSFLITAAILLAYGTIDDYLCQILTKRSLSELVEMNAANQHGYCILAFFRQGLALLIAVNLFAIPLTLFYFHQFPLLSLLYNLFFPLLITGSIGLMIFGMMTAWIPLVGSTLNFLNDNYTKMVLQLTYGMPEFADFNLKSDFFYIEWLVGYLTSLILVLILLKESIKVHEVEDNFTFI